MGSLESLRFLLKQRIVTSGCCCLVLPGDAVLPKGFCDSDFLKGQMQRRNLFVLLVGFVCFAGFLLNSLCGLAFLMLCFFQQESFALTACRTNQKCETKTNQEGIWVILGENSFRQGKYRVQREMVPCLDS